MVDNWIQFPTMDKVWTDSTLIIEWCTHETFLSFWQWVKMRNQWHVRCELLRVCKTEYARDEKQGRIRGSISRGRVGRSGKPRKVSFVTDRRTDGPTDGPTDKVAYRVASPRLKIRILRAVKYRNIECQRTNKFHTLIMRQGGAGVELFFLIKRTTQWSTKESRSIYPPANVRAPWS